MPTPRVAAIHDMSGFGRCSLTVAIPVLSAMGVQCCPLPTAYLSTHTGGFTGYTFLDMTDELPKTAAHWAELGIHFDAVYTGFMGSEAQMDLAADFVRTFRRDRSTITFSIGHIIHSATICARIVSQPVPISAAPIARV